MLKSYWRQSLGPLATVDGYPSFHRWVWGLLLKTGKPHSFSGTVPIFALLVLLFVQLLALLGAGSISTVVAYNDDNQLATFNATSPVHDAAGNMTSGSLPSGTTGTYGYDSRNRLTSAGGSTYRYNPDGVRVETTGTGAATSVVDPSGLSRVLARTVGGTTTRYVWGLGLLYEVTGSTARYYHADQVGSTVALTDSTGAVTDRVDYAPFGEVLARMGSTATPFLYNGESGVETDANGLLYMRSRFYHPRLMRFLNADPIRFEGGMNWYAFAGYNPLGYLDPNGTERVAAGADLDYGLSKVQAITNDQRAAQERWESPAGQAARSLIPFVNAIAEYQLGDTDAAIRSAAIDTNIMALGGIAKMGSTAKGVTSSSNGLIHLTTAEGKAGILTDKILNGRNGIFAVPSNVAKESRAMKMMRTGLTPDKTTDFVEIPKTAEIVFKRPIPIGPYSTIKYLGGVRYPPAGSIDMTTGAFSPSKSFIGPRVLIYGPDVLAYGGIAGGAAAAHHYHNAR